MKIKNILIFLGILLIFLPGFFFLGRFLAEKYFFDKFFYKKSVEFGYWVNSVGKKSNFQMFGDRTKDMVGLYGKAERGEDATKEKPGENLRYYVVVIGDEKVWGLGIKPEERFTEILQKKLSKIRPQTKVIAVSNIGDGFLSYLAKYDMAKKYIPADLFIFTLSDSNLLLDPNGEIGKNDYKNIIKKCREENGTDPTYGLDWSKIDLNNFKYSSYVKPYRETLKNMTNWCIANETLRQEDQAISLYFIADDYERMNSSYKAIEGMLTEQNKNYIDTFGARKEAIYKKYWSKPFNKFKVSMNENSPSVFANQMYADILYKEITQNDKYGFR